MHADSDPRPGDCPFRHPTSRPALGILLRWALLGLLCCGFTAHAQVILVLADDLNYTFIVPAVPERFQDDRRVEVRVGVNAAASDPILTFSFDQLRQERRLTRQADASLRGQRFEIEITHPSRTFSTSFIVGQTLGTLFEDAVWDRDRFIEGASPFVLLQGGVHVPAGVTLTIRGGAVIDGFEPAFSPSLRNRSPFLVDGTLLVENATLKNLLINTDNLFLLKGSAAEQIRIADSTLTNVVLDAHMSGSTALLNVTSTLDDPGNRWTLRPFGSDGDLVVQNCTFSHRLQVLPPQFEGITPPKVVFQANRFTNPSDLEVQPVAATFEFLGNTFTTGGIRLAVADGRGFLIENNTASRINTLPASNRDPSDDFAIRITQNGTADGAVRRIRGNQGVATVDLRADDVDVRDNLITLPTLQNRGDYQAGIFVAGSDNVIENNTVTGPARGSFGIRVGHRNVAGFRTDDNADADRNRVLGNTVTRWLDGGIALHSGDHNMIEGNFLRNNSPNFLLGSEDKSPAAAVPGPGNRFSNNHVSKPFRSGVDRPFNFFVDGLCAVLFCPMTLDGGGITPGTSIAGGPSLGGNFWDHYQGTDANGDGIGDTPFVLGNAGTDNYVDRFPLLEPPPVVDIIVNLVGDEPDADLADGVADVDLGRAGLQTTLRAAIQTANTKAGPDVIRFDFSQGGPTTGSPLIRPKTRLPAITEEVLVDATSIPGGVQIDGVDIPRLINPAARAQAIGQDAPPAGEPPSLAPGNGLHIQGGLGVIVRNLSVTGFETGIRLEDGERHIIENCRLGTTPSLTQPELGNGTGIHAVNIRDLAVRDCVVGHSHSEGIRFDRVVNGIVQGCRVGLSPAKDLLPNQVGIHIGNSHGCLIGGGDAGQANTVAGNRDAGISLFDREPPAPPHRVVNNVVGALDADSNDDGFGNGTGLVLEGPGVARIEGNRIAFNRGHGIHLVLGEPNGQPAPMAGVILDNRIHDNAGLGIEAGNPGPERDTLPTLAFEVVTGGSAIQRNRLLGAFKTESGRRVRFQLFGNKACDPSSFGEGESPFAVVEATADSTGLATLGADIPAAELGKFYSATATFLTPGGEPISTTEFGPCLGALIVNIKEDLPDAVPGDGIADVDLAADGLQTSLRAALDTAREIPGTDLILFDLPLDNSPGEFATVNVTLGDLPLVDHPVHLDGRLLQHPDGRVVLGSAANRLLQFVPGSEDSAVRNLTLLSFSQKTWLSARDIRGLELDAIKAEANSAFLSEGDALVSFERVSGSVIKNSTFASDNRLCLELRDCQDVVVGGVRAIGGEEVSQGNSFEEFVQAAAIVGAASRGNEFSGNNVGTEALDDAINGLLIQGATETRVTDNTFEVEGTGVLIEGETARLNRIQRNRFQAVLEMPEGVWIRGGASNNLIGAGPGEPVSNGNTFSGFVTAIAVTDGTRNRAVGNRFESNSRFRAKAFIDLAYEGPNVSRERVRTPNDSDPGPPTVANQFQNYPELLFLDADDGLIFGELVSAPNSTYLVEVLGGFGARHLGFLQVTTGPDGRAVFQVQPPAPEGIIHFAATDSFGNTSEISPTRLIYSVNTTRDGTNTQMDGLNHTGTGNDRSLRAALEDARTIFLRDPETAAAIHFRIPGTVGGELLANPQLALDASPLPEIRFPGELGTAPDPEIVERLSGLPSAVPGRFATNPRATVTSVHTNAPIAALRIDSSQRFHLERLTFGGFPGGGLLVNDCEQVVIQDCQVEGTGSADPLGNIPGILVQDSRGNPGSIVLSKVNLITNTGDGLRVTVKEAATRIRVEESQVLDNRRNGIVVEGIGKERLDIRLLNNLVGGHAFNGIELRNASGVVLTGNRVGLETELRSRPNQFSGVVLRGVSEFNEIGGTTPGSANLVGANVNAGIALIGPGVRFNQIHGNTIGDPFADGAFGNDTGILIQEASDNRIGRPGAGNDILRNRNAGITLRGPAGTFAQENRISANRFLANEVGVLLERAINNFVGIGPGQGPEDGNEFLPVHGAAIRVLQGTNNHFLGNRMIGNVKAIELLNGSHGGLQPPRIIGTEHDGQTLRIDIGEGTGLSGQVTYEVFLNPGPVLSVREFCERADRFLGRVTVTGDGIPGRRILNLPVGQFPETSIAVTATVDNVGTSPLSNCHPIITLDSDGDGTSDKVEEDLAAGSSNDPLRSAVPGFPAGGGGPVFTPIRIENSNPAEAVRFRSTVGGRMDEALVPPPANIEFPLGFFGFVVEVSQPGDAVTLRLGPLPADLTRFNCLFKLARKTPEGDPEWFCLQDAFFDPVSREWVFTLRDGFLGDFDLLLDSLIVDPIAVAFDPALPPLQAGPRLGIVHTPAGAILLRLEGTAGRRYQWQQALRLDDSAAWVNLGDAVTAGADGGAEFTDSPGEAPRFYRVVEVE